MDSMYEILMALPLFHGVSYSKMSEVVGKTKFHFLKYLDGEQIVNAGDPCSHIKFIISGKVRTTVSNADGRFRISQTLSNPDVIAPEYLFGRNTNYPCRAVAQGSAGILQIAKAEYVKILNSDEVFMFNYLNLLSVYAQKAADGVLSLTNGSLEERIAFWVLALTQRGGSNLVLSCKQRDLYSLFGVQRMSFMATLERMRERGLIDYDQNEIRFRDRADLLALLTLPHSER